MKALLKIEWIKTWRSWPVFIMSIGMPVGFSSCIQVWKWVLTRATKSLYLVLYVDDDRIFYVQLWFLYLSLHA